jgi:DNA-directed RNA polymerase specialized sigma24 family protein
MTIDETAEVLELSPATVKRHWTTARAWLNRDLSTEARRDG